MQKTLNEVIDAMERAAATGGKAGETCGDAAEYLKQLRLVQYGLVIVCGYSIISTIVTIIMQIKGR